MAVHYTPGASPVAVTPLGFAVLADDASPALAARIHALVADGRGLGGVLEALTGAYGTSLAGVPPFAVALAERGSVRLAVRGAFALEVESAAAERISGEGVTTWTERVIPGVSRVTLAGETDAAPPELPVTDGVVLAGALVWVPEGAESEGAAAAAAVREPERKASPAPEPEAAPAPEPEAEPAPEAEAAAASAPEAEPAPEPAAKPERAPRPAAAKAPAASAPAAAAASVPVAAPEAPAPAVTTTVSPTTTSPALIDSAAVLSLADADTLLPAESTFVPAHEPDEAAAPEPEIEATIVRPKGEPVAPPVVLGDHDGATISVAEARALRTGDSVPPLAPPRAPAPGRIRVSTGQVMTLDRTVVIGRRPRSTRVSGTDLPHLVAVDSPQQDISRSHVELRVEGDSIVATDLHTTNGTTLLRAGVEPMRLHPGEGTVVVPGDVIDLGDGITVAIEELA